MNFIEDFDRYVNRIFNNKTPTAWARYADGERLIIENNIVGSGTQATDIDKWTYNNNILFSSDLKNTLTNLDDNYHYAISCECCDYPGWIYYSSVIKNYNKSYANLWINANYKKFLNVISTITEDVIIIGNECGVDKQFPFPVKKYLPIPNDVCNFYEKNKESFVSELKDFCDFSDTLVFISAGPLSAIIIHELWKLNKTNRYIDIGSSLGHIIHGSIIRPYMNDGSYYSTLVCKPTTYSYIWTGNIS